MVVYYYVLVLINSSQDGVLLFQYVVRMVEENGMCIIIVYISIDYWVLNYVFDSLCDDWVLQEVIQVKVLFNELVCIVFLLVDIFLLVIICWFEDVEICVWQWQIDLIIVGYYNWLLGVFFLYLLEYINYLNLDVLIKYLFQCKVVCSREKQFLISGGSVCGLCIRVIVWVSVGCCSWVILSVGFCRWVVYSVGSIVIVKCECIRLYRVLIQFIWQWVVSVR